MTNKDLSKKWNHTSSPITKRKNALKDKLASKKITKNEEIELNNINIEFCKDCIKNNSKDIKFSEVIFDQIEKIKKQNKLISKKITLKNKIKLEKKPRIFHLRKRPRK
jgi:hypothetical protein